MGKMFTEQEVRAMLRQVRKETRQEVLSEKKRPRVQQSALLKYSTAQTQSVAQPQCLA